MGLYDLLIYHNVKYNNEKGNKILDKLFETIAVNAYRTLIDIAIY